MLVPTALFLVFTLLATVGATWIAYEEKGLRVAVAVALGSLLFFAGLAVFVLWVLDQGLGAASGFGAA